MTHDRQRDRAIALRYSGHGAPRVTAKGDGDVATRIVAIARENDIPLHYDPQLAALLSRVGLGDEIPRELFVAVAEVIAFAYAISGREPPAPSDAASDGLDSGKNGGYGWT